MDKMTIQHPKYVVITPVRDEEKHIGKTIDSMMRQSLLPAQWIIVDDGSTDKTPEIIDLAARNHTWIYAIHRSNRGFRKSGGGVVEAFYDGYAAIEKTAWDYLVKLDGDLSFDWDYFEKCFAHFECERNLGIGGGTILVIRNGHPEVDSTGDPPFHVRGATKIYRRLCWTQIAPLVNAPGWDTIDEFKANMHQWTTRTFNDLNLLQHKPTGSADGNWRNWFKNGLGSYITGYHPLFMLAKCLNRLMKKPFLTASIALGAGYLSGYAKRVKQLNDRQVIEYLRKEQIKRLLMRPSIYG